MTAAVVTVDSINWRLAAACADVDPEMFFPLNSRSQDIERAIQVCYRCPVRTQCLDDTLTLPLPMLHVGMVAGGRYFPTRSNT